MAKRIQDKKCFSLACMSFVPNSPTSIAHIRQFSYLKLIQRWGRSFLGKKILGMCGRLSITSIWMHMNLFHVPPPSLAKSTSTTFPALPLIKWRLFGDIHNSGRPCTCTQNANVVKGTSCRVREGFHCFSARCPPRIDQGLLR